VAVAVDDDAPLENVVYPSLYGRLEEEMKYLCDLQGEVYTDSE